MNNIFIIAKNTFKETIRDRILYAILAFAVLFLLSTVIFGSISLGEDIKVIKDFGLAGIYIFSIIIAIFLGTSLIYKEIEKKTLYILLSKPVSSVQFIVGKYFGLFASVVLNIAVMSIIYLGIIAYKGGGFDYLSLWSLLLLVFETSIFIGLTILFSTITTPLAGMIYSVIVLYIGHSLSLLKQASAQSNQFMKILTDIVYYGFPNLEKFNIRNLVVYGANVTSSEIIFPIFYSIFFTIILLWISSFALKKKDL
jgi:ABC-type transport system involved in multi-copper enzyme maturation permease subunit